MKNTSFWDKRIPTVLALVLLLVGLSATSWLVRNGVPISSQADSKSIPENIRITNISDTSFTISFSTQKQVIGIIRYGIDSRTNSVAIDDRDKNFNVSKKYFMHHVTIQGLQPQTKYFFAIIADNKEFLNNDAFFETTTAPKLEIAQNSSSSLKGTVAFPDDVSEETIVYVTNQNAQTFSSIVTVKGTYEIPLDTLRTRDLLTYFSFPDEEILQMLVISPTYQSIVTLTGNQRADVPLILLSEQYDFTITPRPAVLSAFDEKISFPIIGTKKTSTSSARKRLLSPTSKPRTTISPASSL